MKKYLKLLTISGGQATEDTKHPSPGGEAPRTILEGSGGMPSRKNFEIWTKMWLVLGPFEVIWL